MLYKELDTDGDGMVSFDEFLVLIRKSLEAVRARKLAGVTGDDDENMSEEKRRRIAEAEALRKKREGELGAQVALFEKYIEDSGLTSSFQLIFGEIITKKIPKNNVFTYTAMRLRQIGSEI